jgi:hypothetical protein
MISALSGERGEMLHLNGRGAVESPCASQRRSALCDITSIHLFIIEYVRLYGIAIPVRGRGEVKCPNEVHSVDVLMKFVSRVQLRRWYDNALSNSVPRECQGTLSVVQGG